MWHKEYRDYKTDQPQTKQPIEPGHGICGCEMHEINGWGNSLHHPKKRKQHFLAKMMAYLFGEKKK